MRNEDVIMSQKSYLIRAMYEWMLDYGYTPRLVVCPLVNGVAVPDYLGNQNQVTLDISPQAITGLMLGNENVTFEAYFDKSPYEIVLPMNCIGAIIAKEKEVGYVFDIDDFIPQKAIHDLETNLNQESVANSNLESNSQQASSKKLKSTTPKTEERRFKKTKENSQSSVLSFSKKKPASKLSKSTKNDDGKNTKGKKKKETLLSSLRKKINV